jgi:hypothetical protein
MRRPLACLVVLFLASCTLVDTQASEHVTAKDLLATPARFNNRLVNVSGRATAARLAPGMSPTYTFSLDDGTQRVEVVARGAPACQATDRVTVEGWFRASPGVGFGRVEAISVVCR